MEKKLENWQLEDSARLLIMLKKYMEDNHLSQGKLLESLDYSQSMFFQLFGSKNKPPERPLSYDHAFAFSKLLNVGIDQISPTIANKINEMFNRVNPNNEIAIKSKEQKVINTPYKIEILGEKEFKKQLDFFYNGMSMNNKEALVLIANKLYEIDHPTDSSASGRKPKKQEKAKQ